MMLGCHSAISQTVCSRCYAANEYERCVLVRSLKLFSVVGLSVAHRRRRMLAAGAVANAARRLVLTQAQVKQEMLFGVPAIWCGQAMTTDASGMPTASSAPPDFWMLTPRSFVVLIVRSLTISYARSSIYFNDSLVTFLARKLRNPFSMLRHLLKSMSFVCVASVSDSVPLSQEARSDDDDDDDDDDGEDRCNLFRFHLSVYFISSFQFAAQLNDARRRCDVEKQALDAGLVAVLDMGQSSRMSMTSSFARDR